MAKYEHLQVICLLELCNRRATPDMSIEKLWLR
jgi:hypothetical protein